MEERQTCQRYRECAARLMSMVSETGEKQKNELNSLLDELNSLAYSGQGLVEQEPGRLLCQACLLVPLHDELLVTKVCQLIVIVTHQKGTLSQATVETLLEYVVAAMRQCQPWTLPETLRALGAVVYENGPKCSQFLPSLLSISPQGLLMKLVTSKEDDVRRPAVQCIGNLCMRDESGGVIDGIFLQTCYDVLIDILQTAKPVGIDDYTHVRLLLSTLRGLQNILAVSKDVHSKEIGPILAVLKAYMLYGLPGFGTNFTIPSTIYPSHLYQYDSGPSPSKSPVATTPRSHPSRPDGDDTKTEEVFSLRPGGGGGSSGLRFPQPKPHQAKKGKKKGKGRQQEKDRGVASRSSQEASRSGGGMEGMGHGHEARRNIRPQTCQEVDVTSILLPSWGRVTSSESEYSDTEGGQVSRMRAAASKVRQAALTCLHCVVRNTEKKLIFGYWSAFIPDTSTSASSPQSFNLFTSMLKDPAPKARVGSIIVLAAFLEGSRQFLAAADDSDLHRSAFTPFSHTLAATIKEIHRCLLLALLAESFSTTLTQIIKCLSILVQNVLYHKLSRGLLTKIVTGIRPYFFHKDNNVRTACLTCMGAILSTAVPLPEITALLKNSDFLKSSTVPASSLGAGSSSWRRSVDEPCMAPRPLLTDRKGNVEETLPVESSEAVGRLGKLSLVGGESDTVLPDDEVRGCAGRGLGADGRGCVGSCSEGATRLWLVKWCSDVILVRDTQDGTQGINRFSVGIEALPVRLEALQVMAQLVKGYLGVIRDILDHVCCIIVSCLLEKDPSVQLHGLKVLEELGKVMLAHLTPDLDPPTVQLAVPLTPDEVVLLWDRLLSGPLQCILQNSANCVLQASACYCLSTIGPQCFSLLKNDKRVLCITLLLGLSTEEDYRVKAASVRALGAYVLYPCLREDVMFVADTANAILTCLCDVSVNVRIRAAWSLGNLSDALIANKDAGDSIFLEDFSDMLLERLFAAAIAGAADHDKVKSNAVRALGMLVRFARPQALDKSSIQAAIDDAIEALLKNITTGATTRVKVRWNACYAMGNVFKNEHLELASASWSTKVFTALTDLVRDCKNFKVRINASLALSVPTKRCCYGDADRFCLVWSSLIHALEVIDQVADVSELKYKDTLRDQLCQTLAHLAALITKADLSPLRKLLMKDTDTMLTGHMRRYSQATPAEADDNGSRGDVLSATLAHLQEVGSQEDMTNEEKNCSQDLMRIFTDACTVDALTADALTCNALTCDTLTCDTLLQSTPS